VYLTHHNESITPRRGRFVADPSITLSVTFIAGIDQLGISALAVIRPGCCVDTLQQPKDTFVNMMQRIFPSEDSA
jgi:hypothetical protein